MARRGSALPRRPVQLLRLQRTQTMRLRVHLATTIRICLHDQGIIPVEGRTTEMGTGTGTGMLEQDVTTSVVQMSNDRAGIAYQKKMLHLTLSVLRMMSAPIALRETGTALYGVCGARCITMLPNGRSSPIRPSAVFPAVTQQCTHPTPSSQQLPTIKTFRNRRQL
jgi:hypothetical protein